MSLLPPPLIRTSRGTRTNIDYNWLWEQRTNPRYTELIADYFFSPTISQDVRDYLSDSKMRKLYSIRKLIKQLANNRRTKTQRNLHDILSSQEM